MDSLTDEQTDGRERGRIWGGWTCGLEGRRASGRPEGKASELLGCSRVGGRRDRRTAPSVSYTVYIRTKGDIRTILLPKLTKSSPRPSAPTAL
ncbi:hypothetical protein DPMN_060183 [Dreissena polymorpha]|uniref:Uncharacterized protein n=1 Tax=Dreissena polymorpha TaxID=45954 RepID=A0A9D4C594_DREPO|nr:hypothetical protein DPMN_060183 [Dreissena polymorpha]